MVAPWEQNDLIIQPGQSLAPWEQHDPVVQSPAPWEQDDPIVQAPKKIGFGEAFIENPLQKIPFSPMGAFKTLDLVDAARRLNTGYDYKEPIFPYQIATGDLELDALQGMTIGGTHTTQQKDIDLITKYLEGEAEKAERGYNIWGRIGQITSAMPAFMMEFMATGGIKQLGSQTAKRYGTKLLGKYATTTAGKAALATGRFAVGTAARATAMPHRAAESVLRRRLPRGIEIDATTNQVTLTGPEESQWTSLWKGLVDHYIEIASEETGEFMGPVAGRLIKRLPFGSRFIGALQKSWLKKFPKNTAAQFYKKIGTQAGFHGTLTEMGEERIGTISRAILDIEDFGAGSDATIGQRLLAGLKQDIENLPAELIAFSIPGVARAVPGIIVGRREISRIEKNLKDVQKSEEYTDEQKVKISADIERNLVRVQAVTVLMKEAKKFGIEITEEDHQYMNMGEMLLRLEPIYEKEITKQISGDKTLVDIQKRLDIAYKNNDMEAFSKILEEELVPLPAEEKKYLLQGHAELVQMKMKTVLEETMRKAGLPLPEDIEEVTAPDGIAVADAWVANRIQQEKLKNPQISKKELKKVAVQARKDYARLEPTTADEAIGEQYNLTPKETRGRLGKAELRYRELKNKPVEQRTRMEKKELAFLKRSRKNIEAILERETRPIEVKPKKQRRPQLLKQGHDIPDLLGMTEPQRRQFMKNLTGLSSMKKMKRKQLLQVVDAFRKEAEKAGIRVDPIGPGDYSKPVTVDRKPTTMEKIVDETAQIIDELPAKVDLPKHVHRRYFKKLRQSNIGKQLGRILWGIDNSPLYELANILEQGRPGVLTRIFDDNLQQGRAVEAGHKRQVAQVFKDFCEENNITRQDLAALSESCNPRAFHELQERLGYERTTIHTVEINKRKYDMTSAELLDVYLIAQQEDGMRHIRRGGLVINGVKTGKIADAATMELTAIVENNPQLKQLADVISYIESEIWKPTINQTSVELDNRKIATVEKWWGLEVLVLEHPIQKMKRLQELTPKQLAGKEQKFNVNLIEDKGILRGRLYKANSPLVVRDALQRFTNFENAIAEYVGLAQPTRIARTLINDRDFNEQLRVKGYSHLLRNMKLILERAQSAPQTSGGFDRFLGKMLPGVYRAVLFFNPRVVMSQYTSSTNYEAFVSNKYAGFIIKGFESAVTQKRIRKTLEMSDIAWDRYYMGHSSLELGELAASDATLRMLTKTSADKNKMGIGLRYADMAALAVGIEIATAEYKDAQSEKISGISATYWAGKDVSAKIDSSDGKAAITKRAEWLWHKSQPSWDKWSRSAITSDPSAIKRLFFLFRSFHEKSLTILHGAHTEWEGSTKTAEDVGRYAKKYGAVLAGYTLNTALRAAIMVGLTFKVKDEWDYLKDIITAPFAMLPILGHILDASIRSFFNTLTEHRSEYRGEAIESLPIEVANQISRSPINFIRAATSYLSGDAEKGTETLKKAVGQAYMGLGMAMGVPVYELKRIPWLPHPLEKDEKEDRGLLRPRKRKGKKRRGLLTPRKR